MSRDVHGQVRGVVQWFDTRTGRGALRLQGLGNDHAVEAAAARHVGDGIENLLDGEAGRHGDDLFKRLARQVGIAELVDGQQRGLDAEPSNLAQEVLARLNSQP